MDKLDFDSLELDAEEREILEAYESGELVPVVNQEEVIARVRAAAAATLRKDRRVNIRITAPDLVALQSRAVEEGIPYQTLMASILHKYVTGRLVERPRMTVAELALLEERESYKT